MERKNYLRACNLDLIWNEEEERFHIVQYPGAAVIRIRSDMSAPGVTNYYWFLQRPGGCEPYTWNSSWLSTPHECIETLRSVLLKKVWEIESERRGD